MDPHLSSVSLPKSMTAAVLEKHGHDLVLKQVPVPQPGPQEVLVRLVTCGVCHTDLHVRNGDWYLKSQTPIIPGHEGAGVVMAVGRDVEHVQVGDRVGCGWLHDSCLRCHYCLTGWETLCPHQKPTGFFSDGCFAEFTTFPSSFVTKIPAKLSFSQASPILCAGVTAYKGLKMTGVKPAEWVAVVGASGGLGHLAVGYARAMGMKVLAIDVGPDRIKYCMSLGCDAAVDASLHKSNNKMFVRAVQSAVGGDGLGPHGALVLAPVPAAFEQALAYIRPGGTLCSVGLAPGTFACDIFDLVVHGKKIVGSIVGTRADMEEALGIAAGGKFECKVEMRGFGEINDVMKSVQEGKVKGRMVLKIADEEVTGGTGGSGVQKEE